MRVTSLAQPFSTSECIHFCAKAHLAITLAITDIEALRSLHSQPYAILLMSLLLLHISTCCHSSLAPTLKLQIDDQSMINSSAIEGTTASTSNPCSQSVCHSNTRNCTCSITSASNMVTNSSCSNSPHAVSSPSSERSVRIARNVAEKQRRDKLNAYITDLANTVPLVSSATKRLDKTSILRLSAAYIRLHESPLSPLAQNVSNFTSREDNTVNYSLAKDSLLPILSPSSSTTCSTLSVSNSPHAPLGYFVDTNGNHSSVSPMPVGDEFRGQIPQKTTSISSCNTNHISKWKRSYFTSNHLKTLIEVCTFSVSSASSIDLYRRIVAENAFTFLPLLLRRRCRSSMRGACISSDYWLHVSQVTFIIFFFLFLLFFHQLLFLSFFVIVDAVRFPPLPLYHVHHWTNSRFITIFHYLCTSVTRGHREREITKCICVYTEYTGIERRQMQEVSPPSLRIRP